METTKKISVRQVTRDYNKIASWLERNHPKVESSDCDDCKTIQTYRCHCGKDTHTWIADYGTVPMFHNCSACGDMATSNGKKEIQESELPEIDEVWYFPKLEEVLKLRKNPSLLDHVLNGGLLNIKTHKLKDESNTNK